MAREAFSQMDLNQNGYISKDEYLKLNARRAGENYAVAAFEAMDTDHDGKVISTW